MKAILPLFLAVTVSSTFVAQAQTPATPPADPSAAPKEADSPAKAELGKVVEAIKAKLAAGKKSEAELKDELAQFDAIADKYKSDAEAGSNILFMKAMLYLQIIDQPEKGKEVLAKIKKEYPDTKIGQNIDRVLASIDQQEASNKLNSQLKPGSAFPPFSVTSLDGKAIDLAKYKGKVVLIDFWATWCGPCVQELPNVLSAYKLYHDKGFEIIGISLDESKDKLEAFLKENNMTWPQFFDGKGWGNELAQKYGINSIPATYLLDTEGNIIARDLRGAGLEAAVAKALAK
jgi:thiol-disulfide isomerase/thioredoxin